MFYDDNSSFLRLVVDLRYGMEIRGGVYTHTSTTQHALVRNFSRSELSSRT